MPPPAGNSLPPNKSSRRLGVWFLLALSLLANAYFILGALWERSNAPVSRIGRLRYPVAVGHFGDDKVIFKLPAGVTVKDESPRGFATFDLWEPRRFSLIVTSDRELVDFNIERDGLAPNGSYYSADVTKAQE
jgi:hypothetical protein